MLGKKVRKKFGKKTKKTNSGKCRGWSGDLNGGTKVPKNIIPSRLRPKKKLSE